jgi:hypothetical protein
LAHIGELQWHIFVLHWLILLSFIGSCLCFTQSPLAHIVELQWQRILELLWLLGLERVFYARQGAAADIVELQWQRILELLWLLGLERVFYARQGIAAELRQIFQFWLASRLLPWRASWPW